MMRELKIIIVDKKEKEFDTLLISTRLLPVSESDTGTFFIRQLYALQVLQPMQKDWQGIHCKEKYQQSCL